MPLLIIDHFIITILNAFSIYFIKEDEFFNFRKQSPRPHYQRTDPELLKL
jgi:hypothetical protein